MEKSDDYRRCDSLSNLYLWHIKYSTKWGNADADVVVIRFQICIFDILNTANVFPAIEIERCDSLSNLYLWHIKYSSLTSSMNLKAVVIRFQICIFDILNTAISLHKHLQLSCDSLSNLYLWHIKYSATPADVLTELVVIRFQICIFDILNTACPW